MKISQIESNLEELLKSFSKQSFIYDLLTAYGLPKASITRLRQGNLNLSKNDDIIIWKKKLFYQVIEDDDLHDTIDDLVKDSNTHKHNPRFIIVTDY